MNRRISLRSPFSMVSWGAKKLNTTEHHSRNVVSSSVIVKEKDMEARGSSSALQQIALLLIQADRLVKAGDYKAAMEIIKKARAQSPNHLYAIAYEERIGALMQAQIENKKKMIDKAQKVPERMPQHQEFRTDIKPKISVQPSSLSSGANVHSEYKKEEKTAPSENNRQFQQKKIAAFLLQAENHFHRNEFNRALDEIARAYLLDPFHREAHELEERVRRAVAWQFAEKLTLKSHALLEKEKQKKLAEELTAEHRKRLIEQKVNALISLSASLIEKKEYNRALEEISRAYILDPAHPQLPIMEEKIYNAELKKGETAQNKYNFHDKEQLNYTLRKETFYKEKSEHIQNRKPIISEWMTQISELLSSNRLEEALNEVTTLVINDPFNERILKLERVLIEAQHKQFEERRNRCREIVDAIDGNN